RTPAVSSAGPVSGTPAHTPPVEASAPSATHRQSVEAWDRRRATPAPARNITAAHPATVAFHRSQSERPLSRAAPHAATTNVAAFQRVRPAARQASPAAAPAAKPERP